MKKGFTIVELLVVIAIIGVLVSIVSTAAVGAIKNGRAKRASVMRTAFEQAISAYYAQEGRWPGVIEAKAKNMGTEQTYELKPTEADAVFQEIVKNSVGSSASRPLIDASGLFVADSSKVKNSGKGCLDEHSDKSSSYYCGNQHCVSGLDFAEATKKGGKHRISINNMAFGYQGPECGRFCRYRIIYNGQTDAVTVAVSHETN